VRYINRDIENILKTAVRQFPSAIVAGPRQSGKTTLVKHLFSKSHRYVSMDNPELQLMAIEDPALFFQNYPPPIIIDEIQHTPQLFPFIKILIDKNRKKRGQFILTGSQIFPLMAKVGESLAGRIAVFTLLPFSFREQFGKHIPQNFDIIKKRCLTGGFPEVVLKRGLDVELWFAGYLQTYLERDVRQLREIGNLTDFQRFLQLVASLNGQVCNLSTLSNNLGVAVNTTKAWISILEASGQIFSVKPFYINKGKRIIKSPKIYFLDTGLLCYLIGISSTKQIFKGPFSGQLFETLLLGEIVKNFHNHGKIPKVFWWRTSYGEEVDFVIEDRGKVMPLEVKLSSKANKKLAKGLFSFCKLFNNKIDISYLVNLSGDKLTLDKKVVAIPFADFLQYINKL